MLIKMKENFECEIENIRHSFKKDHVFDANFEQVLFLVEKKRVAEVVTLPKKKKEEKKPAKVEPPKTPEKPVVKPVVKQEEKKPVKTPAKPRKRASRKKK